MRKVLTSLAVLGALVVASSSQAAVGTVYMGWNACNTTPTTDVTVTAGQTTGLNLTLFVTGQDVPTSAYSLQIFYGDANKTVPDAWRFDAAGCQTSQQVTINHLAPKSVSASCPSFENAGGTHASLQIINVDFNPASLGYPTTLMRILFYNSYPDGNVPVAGTNYFLMDAEFNQAFGSVGPTPPDQSTCGGVETAMCFNLNFAHYLDMSGNELPWPIHGGATGDWVTTNAFGSGCQNTPAQPRTWGSIKNQYRN